MSEIERAAANMWPEWELTNGDYAHKVFIMGARKLLELADENAGALRRQAPRYEDKRYISIEKLKELVEGEK